MEAEWDHDFVGDLLVATDRSLLHEVRPGPLSLSVKPRCSFFLSARARCCMAIKSAMRVSVEAEAAPREDPALEGLDDGLLRESPVTTLFVPPARLQAPALRGRSRQAEWAAGSEEMLRESMLLTEGAVVLASENVACEHESCTNMFMRSGTIDGGVFTARESDAALLLSAINSQLLAALLP